MLMITYKNPSLLILIHFFSVIALRSFCIQIQFSLQTLIKVFNFLAMSDYFHIGFAILIMNMAIIYLINSQFYSPR